MIKSFVSLPNKQAFSNLNVASTHSNHQKLLAYYELYKLIKDIDGSIVKCGITTDEAFSYFSFFKKVNDQKHALIAFEKVEPVLVETQINNEAVLAVRKKEEAMGIKQASLAQKGMEANITFLPGILAETIPNYIIDNPELKIALLTIDLDDFDNTLTAMQYLYPRIVTGGVLIINNFFKKRAEYEAINEYFFKKEATIQKFFIDKSPHYIIKE